MQRVGMAALLIVLMLGGIGMAGAQETEASTETVVPTETAAPTATPAPAETVSPVTTLVPPTQEIEATPTPTATPEISRDFVVGDYGDDVYAFKLRMQELGYFKSSVSVSRKVSDITLERVNEMLVANGMETTDTITMEIQAMVYAKNELSVDPTPTPSPTPEPLLMPESEPELPELDDEGFLAEEGGEYVYADEEEGLWYYISDDLYVNIRRYNDQDAEIIWYETEIKTRGDQQLQSYLTDGDYAYNYPVSIAQDNQAVIAFTDDFFAKRSYGVSIRYGEIYRNKFRRTSTSFPIADTLAVFADGSMKTYDYNAYTAEEYLEMGAVHVLTFGPWLISDGEINERVLSDTYMPYDEPRNAIGMIEPGHYVVITVDGRYDGAEGVRISWLAERMLEIGVTEALNLDGGATTALVFMGTQISRVASGQSDGTGTRRVSSMLGFGTSELVGAE